MGTENTEWCTKDNVVETKEVPKIEVHKESSVPFTFAHPAVIILVNNRLKSKFCLTGLVLGSMAPDFEYFMRLRPFSVYGHNILGFFIFNLPMCFLLAYVFHYVLKNPLILHMPNPMDKWFGHFLHRSWNLGSIKRVTIFVHSALLGMLTHVVWDSFTHAEGIMVKLIPILSTKIFAFGYSIALFKLLQHGSSVIGILIIFACLYSKRSHKFAIQAISANMKLRFFALIIFSSFVLVFGIIYLNTQNAGSVDIGSLIVIIIDCIFMSSLLISLISRSWIKKENRIHRIGVGINE